MTDTQDTHITGIIKTYSKRLMGFIKQRVNNEADAEDILQDVFYQLTESVMNMRPIEQLSSWLFTVTRNKITDSYRKKKPDILQEGYDSDEDITLGIEDILFDEADTPETSLMRSLFWAELKEALAELPPAQSKVFTMHELDGLSFNEISEITGESVNTLLSRKRYAVLYLRERLSDLRKDFLNI